MRFTIEKKRKGWVLYKILDTGEREEIGIYRTQRAAEVRLAIEYDRSSQDV